MEKLTINELFSGIGAQASALENRLMGFTDEQFDRSQAFSSDSQLYKQAGNSIVVDVLYYIFGKLFEVDTETGKETKC